MYIMKSFIKKKKKERKQKASCTDYPNPNIESPQTNPKFQTMHSKHKHL